MGNNDLINLIDSLNKYVQNKSSFQEMDEEFNKYFIESEYDYTEEQVNILEDLNDDIAITVLGDETAEDESDYISESELKMFIKASLKDLS